MFYKYLLILFLFCATLSSNEVVLHPELKFQNLQDDLTLFFDTHEAYAIEKITDDKVSFVPTDKTLIGYIKGVVWSKIELKNESSVAQTILLVNPKISVNQIDIYIFETNILQNHLQVGTNFTLETRGINSRYPNISLTLQPHKTYTVISKLKSKAPLDVNWIATKPHFFLLFSFAELLCWGAFAGIVIALIIYNFMAYRSLKEKVYLVYSIHSFFALMFQFSTNGIFYQFHVYDNLALFNTTNWIYAQLSFVSITVFNIRLLS